MKTSTRARQHTYQIAVKWSTLSHLRHNLCHPVAKLFVDGRIHQKAFWTSTVLTHILKNTATRELVPACSGHEFIRGRYDGNIIDRDGANHERLGTTHRDEVTLASSQMMNGSLPPNSSTCSPNACNYRAQGETKSSLYRRAKEERCHATQAMLTSGVTVGASAQAFMTCRPTLTDPTNMILSAPLLTSAFPVSAKPFTICTSPAGAPAASRHLSKTRW